MPVTKDSVRQIRFNEAGPPDGSGESLIRQYTHESRELEEEDVHIRPRENYPYPRQGILEGEFEYERESFLGTASAEVKFQLRQGSNLLIVQKKSGSAKLSSIVSALDKRLDAELDADIDIHDQFHPTREGIWSFIHSAEWISSLNLRIQSEDIPFEVYREEKDVTFEDVDGQYGIAYADIVFEAPWGDPVSVIYDHGQLEIATDDDDLYEFVLQRFETDVLTE